MTGEESVQQSASVNHKPRQVRLDPCIEEQMTQKRLDENCTLDPSMPSKRGSSEVGNTALATSSLFPTIPSVLRGTASILGNGV